MESTDRISTDNGIQIEKFKQLVGLASLINSSLDQSVIRMRAIEAAKTLLNAEEGSMMLIDRNTNELYFDVVAGETGTLLKKVRIGLDQGVAGWVATNAVPQIVNDAGSDPRFYSAVDKAASFETRSIIAVPLLFQGRVLGVLEAVNKITGPFTQEDLDLFVSLSDLVASAVENANLHEELREAFFGIVLALADALESRDTYTGGHTQRVRHYCQSIGTALQLGKNDMEILLLSAILHDIGKIGVRDAILCKEGPLTREEAALMSEHSKKGAEILSNIKALRNVIPSVMAHHERFDGNGYPDRLSGEDIPMFARIIAVADTFDAMTTDRPYRKALTPAEAFAELLRCSGTQFDPDVVAKFIPAIPEETE
ncbi:putative protein [Geobacter sp. OR-1]|uniref:HD-GYP domain-containing protein n=1 Tax=Geobacter sp. OR-1 TaxID=1266765 RepID=UPI0005420CC3|nr:HD domain-containing phosphohydrolase [Geobacter sp. OR-1]GAM09474.1 putative protein [Geobacter sp. OR-1]